MSPLSFLLASAALAGDLSVRVLDIGQGDAILVQTPAGKTILIDAGDRGSSVVERLESLGVDHLDLAIATHPHADHVGDMRQVVQALPPRVYVDSGQAHTTKVYEELMGAVEANPAIRYQSARPGMTFNLDDGAKLEVIWPDPQRPLAGTRSDLNSNSVITRLTHGEDCFLFTGDAEEPTEAALVAGGLEQCDVLKVAHHGSRHSSGEAFLAAVRPSIALISVGVDNRYEHPGGEALARLTAVGATVYRTDLDGEIVVISTGKGVRIRTANGEGDNALLAVSKAPAGKKAAGRIAAGAPTGQGPTGARLAAALLRAAPDAPEASAAVAHAEPESESTDTTPAAPEPGAACGFPGSGRSEVFHAEGCGNAAKISESNRVCYESREAAIAAGKRPAGCCHP